MKMCFQVDGGWGKDWCQSSNPSVQYVSYTSHKQRRTPSEWETYVTYGDVHNEDWLPKEYDCETTKAQNDWWRQTSLNYNISTQAALNRKNTEAT